MRRGAGGCAAPSAPWLVGCHGSSCGIVPKAVICVALCYAGGLLFSCRVVLVIMYRRKAPTTYDAACIRFVRCVCGLVSPSKVSHRFL